MKKKEDMLTKLTELFPDGKLKGKDFIIPTVNEFESRQAFEIFTNSSLPEEAPEIPLSAVSRTSKEMGMEFDHIRVLVTTPIVNESGRKIRVLGWIIKRTK